MGASKPPRDGDYGDLKANGVGEAKELIAAMRAVLQQGGCKLGALCTGGQTRATFMMVLLIVTLDHSRRVEEIYEMMHKCRPIIWLDPACLRAANLLAPLLRSSFSDLPSLIGRSCQWSWGANVAGGKLLTAGKRYWRTIGGIDYLFDRPVWVASRQTAKAQVEGVVCLVGRERCSDGFSVLFRVPRVLCVPRVPCSVPCMLPFPSLIRPPLPFSLSPTAPHSH